MELRDFLAVLGGEGIRCYPDLESTYPRRKRPFQQETSSSNHWFSADMLDLGESFRYFANFGGK